MAADDPRVTATGERGDLRYEPHDRHPGCLGVDSAPFTGSSAPQQDSPAPSHDVPNHVEKAGNPTTSGHATVTARFSTNTANWHLYLAFGALPEGFEPSVYSLGNAVQAFVGDRGDSRMYF